MKLPLAFILFLPFICLNASAQTAKRDIKQALATMADAAVKGDYDAVADLTYPELFAHPGGRDSMIVYLKKHFLELKKKGIYLQAVNMGEPGNIITINNRQFFLVIETIIMKSNSGSLNTKSTLLGTSNDNGLHWYFMEAGTPDETMIYELFPEIKGKIIIPTQSKPVFTPDPK